VKVNFEHQERMIEGGWQKYRFNCDVDGNLSSITCLICGMTSYNENDIGEQYCGKCHVFHFTPS